jgi:Mce-associated membrane protein
VPVHTQHRPKMTTRVPVQRRTVTRRPPTEGRGPTPPAEPGAPQRRRRFLMVALTVALIAAVAAATVTGYRWYQQQRLDGAHQAALAAARQTTVNFVSVSASTVDRDLQRVLAGATGDFRDEFKRGELQVRAAVVDNNVDSRGTVLRAGLVSGDSDSATVLVAVDATVKNVNAPQGRLSHYRIQVDLTRDHRSGHWLVSRLQFVG